MRPTFSIIVFTVLSGVGYGLWFLIGFGLTTLWPACSVHNAHALCVYPGLIGYGTLLGFLAVGAGLLSSVAHLGKPQRAWRALSQWRSSWLSREGVAALLTFVPAVSILLQQSQVLWQALYVPSGTVVEPWLGYDALRALGAALALGSVLTVVCTANIYASLKPISAWHNRHVVPIYLSIGLYSGALLLWAASTLPASWTNRPDIRLFLTAIIVLAIACAVLKLAYWRDIDRAPSISAGHATGLDILGRVRSFEQPHTEENYLTHEMGFVLARKHSRQLRAIALIAGFAVPAALAVLGLALPTSRVVCAWLALVCGISGIFVERWLFFAEAKHAVMAYYAR